MNPLWNAILVGGHKDGERWVVVVVDAFLSQPNH